jgi:hypothetical protein
MYINFELKWLVQHFGRTQTHQVTLPVAHLARVCEAVMPVMVERPPADVATSIVAVRVEETML